LGQTSGWTDLTPPSPTPRAKPGGGGEVSTGRQSENGQKPRADKGLRAVLGPVYTRFPRRGII